MRVLVGTEVKRPDGHRATGHRFDDLPVGFVLLIFRGITAVLKVEKLGAIQADTVAAFVDAMLGFRRELDVGKQFEFNAILRLSRQIAQPRQFLAEFLVSLLLIAVLHQRRRIGRDDHKIIDAIDDDHVAATDMRRQVGHAHNRWQAHRPQQNRRVRCWSADIDGNADNFACTQGGRQRGRKFVRDQNSWPRQMSEVFPVLTENVSKQAAFDIADVADPLGQDRVIHFLEAPLKAPHGETRSICGGESAVDDEFTDLRLKLRGT